MINFNNNTETGSVKETYEKSQNKQLNKIKNEIKELKDENPNNDKIEIQGTLTTEFAKYLKENTEIAQKLFDNINSISVEENSDNEKVKNNLIIFLTPIINSLKINDEEKLNLDNKNGKFYRKLEESESEKNSILKKIEEIYKLDKQDIYKTILDNIKKALEYPNTDNTKNLQKFILKNLEGEDKEKFLNGSFKNKNETNPDGLFGQATLDGVNSFLTKIETYINNTNNAENVMKNNQKSENKDNEKTPQKEKNPQNIPLNTKIIKYLSSKKDFKQRFKGDANSQLDKYRVTGNSESVKKFNAYIDRAKERLEKHATLSKSDFIKYFGGNGSMLLLDKIRTQQGKEGYGQGNIGNCYFVAALRCLYQSPLYEHFIRTSVSYDKDKKEFTISIPLGNTKAKKYIIGENLLKPQKNRFYKPGVIVPPQKVPLQEVKWVKDKNGGHYEPVFKNGKPVKAREYLKPIRAPKGIQALEAAFLANTSMDKNGKVDRLRMEGGIGSEALRTMLGENNTDQNLFLINREKEKTKKLFNNFHPLTDYVVLGSKPHREGDRKMYKVNGTNIELAHGHAYSVIGTNPNKKTVTLVNPRKLNEPFELTYQQTIDNFCTVMGCKADYRNGFT